MPTTRASTLTVLALLLVSTVPGLALLDAAGQGGNTDPAHEDLPLVPGTTGTLLDTAAATGHGTRIHEIVHPLATVPAIVEDGGTFTLELDPTACSAPPGHGCPPPTTPPEARLTPSFGTVNASIPLDTTLVTNASSGSDVWPHRSPVVKVRVTVPNLTAHPGFSPGLHDLHVDGPLQDTQPRAVSVMDRIPENPRIAVIADPQVGDLRGLGNGFEDSARERDPGPFLFTLGETLGTGTEDERWGAFQRTIREINLLDPDLVLVTGDLTFGQDAPGKYHAEYEDAYRLVNKIRAPTYLAVGNHDGYVQTGEDGLAFWRAYFGPLHYSVDVGSNLHLVSINTYDWSEMDRAAVGFGASAWGGQVREAQLAWLREDLTTWRAQHPDGLIVTFAHHDPSWRQDRVRNATYGPVPGGEAAERTDGVPVAEQFTRGAVSFTSTDQAWSGRNRLALRDTLTEADEGWGGELVHFAGHTHRDRVARVHQGHVVETTQERAGLPAGHDARMLHYVHRDGSFDTARSQAELRGLLQDWSHGPLFVDTTTAASSTNEYWGWRVVDLTPLGTGYDLRGFGYAANASLLQDHARDPGFWNASHADLGIFSTPSYHVDRTVDRSSDGTHVRVHLESRLAEPLDVVVPVHLAAGDLTVDGATVAWHRTDGTHQDLGLALTLPAMGNATATASLS